MILHSAQGFTPSKIAEMLGLSVEWTRHLIHEFNENGFDPLKPLPNKGGTGRLRKFVDESAPRRKRHGNNSILTGIK